MFLVQWAGYDDPSDGTWEPFENVKHLDVLKTFLGSQPRLPHVLKTWGEKGGRR